MGGQFLAEKTDPLASIQFCVTSIVFRRSEDSGFGPGKRYVTKGNEIVLPIDLGKFGVQR